MAWPDLVWSGLALGLPDTRPVELRTGSGLRLHRCCINVGASASTSTSAGPGLRRVGVCGGCMDVEIWWTVSLVDWFAGAVWCGYLWMPVAGLVEIKVAG